MITAADSSQFASTPAGYVITVLVSLLVLIGAWFATMIYREQRHQSDELAGQSAALAVLVARVDPKLIGMDDLVERVGGLERDFLLFAAWRANHNRWAQDERDRLLEAIRGHAVSAPAAPGVRH